MRTALLLIVILALTACGSKSDADKTLQTQIDSLDQKLKIHTSQVWGEFMSGIQVHHAKLWFAGLEQNWALADFEIGEIKETIEDIKLYNTDRPEIKSLPMIEPALDSITNAIQQKNQELFRSSFILLTNTCNNCHRATKHEFNVIKIPTNPPFSNQDFKTK